MVSGDQSSDAMLPVMFQNLIPKNKLYEGKLPQLKSEDERVGNRSMMKKDEKG